MKLRNSTLIGWILTGLICLAFFIPWARFAPEQAANNLLDLAGKLAGDDAPLIQAYLTMRPAEWEAIWHNPGEGLSAYQLVLLSEKNTVSAKVSQAWVAMLWGDENYEQGVKFLALAPILALLGATALSLGKTSPKFLLGVSFGQLLFYGFLRWKLNETYGDRLLLQIEFNLGLWLTLYALLILAALQVTKALSPKSKW
ncbi:MAG: hypothetical protein SH807_11390 [Blastochloris sp.]|jgi:hypothetical protein|nr:hypothetical protein [Blastochloris sp.]